MIFSYFSVEIYSALVINLVSNGIRLSTRCVFEKKTCLKIPKTWLNSLKIETELPHNAH